MEATDAVSGPVPRFRMKIDQQLDVRLGILIGNAVTEGASAFMGENARVAEGFMTVRALEEGCCQFELRWCLEVPLVVCVVDVNYFLGRRRSGEHPRELFVLSTLPRST